MASERDAVPEGEGELVTRRLFVVQDDAAMGRHADVVRFLTPARRSGRLLEAAMLASCVIR